jgi:hypothetical protein
VWSRFASPTSRNGFFKDAACNGLVNDSFFLFCLFLSYRTGNEERTRFQWENNILDPTAAIVTHGIIK